MALPRVFGCLPVAILALAMGCKGGVATSQAAVDLDKRCETMATACGDAKHAEKFTESCKAAAKAQVDKGCADKAIALYDCYQKQACGTGEQVWALDDLRVLAERHNKCGTERTALTTCVGK